MATMGAGQTGAACDGQLFCGRFQALFLRKLESIAELVVKFFKRANVAPLNAVVMAGRWKVYQDILEIF